MFSCFHTAAVLFADKHTHHHSASYQSNGFTKVCKLTSGVKMLQLVYNLADAGETPAKLHSNWKSPTSQLKHFARSYDRTSYVILYTDLTPMCTITHKRISCNKSQWMEIPVSTAAPESWLKLLIFFLLYPMPKTKTSRTVISIHSIFNEYPFRFTTNRLTNQPKCE